MIIDRRQHTKIRHSENRVKFLNRQKKHIKSQVDKIGNIRSIKNIANKAKIKISSDNSINEPTADYNRTKGSKVYQGNKYFDVGDEIQKEGEDDGNGGDGEGEDPFNFFLTREEFISYLLSDLKLPDFTLESLHKSTEVKWVRGGFTKWGPPSRLSIKKTYERALMRKIASKSSGRKPPFLDEDDLRYINTTPHTIPIRKAVMICLMDVSGSMDEKRKQMAKRFFFLLYLFLTTNYTTVELVFIRYHSYAKECTEKEFFYDTDTGGTVASEAFALAAKVIERESKDGNINFYLAQSSDGDYWDTNDKIKCAQLLRTKILPAVRYAAYMQVGCDRAYNSIYEVYEVLHRTAAFKNLGFTIANEYSDIYPAFRTLFEYGGNKK